jgi:hypothetical protein
MKKIVTFIATISILSLIATPLAFAQPRMGGKGSGGWGMGAPYQRMYNPKTVETIAGKVIALDTIPPMRGMAGGVHLRLVTQGKEISVHLGPAWYLDNQDFQIKEGDRIEVTGSRVTFANAPAIIAAQIRRGDRVLTLRDKNGFPAWSGWRRWQ